ncbi:MAG: GNAT family N-acetyltransferase [Myxococcota bacterium]|nr:GNAT family N-acetyltransferase [Myxococcota bacterium]
MPRIDFRSLTEADLPLLFEWLNRPHVAQWWDGPILYNEVLDRYGAHIRSESTSPYVVLLDGVPGGYIQSWVAALESEYWWEGVSDPGVLGIDQLLADPGGLCQGVGTAMVGQFVERRFQDPSVTRIILDTDPENFRAIRCYEKVGFRRVGVGTTPEGPVLLLTIERERFRAPTAASRL